MATAVALFAAVAKIQSLNRELPYAAGTAIKKKKQQQQKKTRIKHNLTS